MGMKYWASCWQKSPFGQTKFLLTALPKCVQSVIKKSMKRLFCLVLTIVTIHATAAPLEINRPWPGVSDPINFGGRYKQKFSELPLRGEIKDKTKLWSGDYWALKKGNINYRWYGASKTGFNLNSPSKEEALKMSVTELAALSPSEKYDLYIGRYDYPLKNQVAGIASPRAQLWEGICHGWAPAAMNHTEPESKLLKNPQGIEIPFGSTDIKALLSYYYAYGFATAPVQMGERCYPESGEGCKDDLNAGAFHIILTNRLGLHGASFIADIESRGEVWNNPAYAYTTTIIREAGPANESAPGTVKVITVSTDFQFADNGENNWRPVIGTHLQVINQRQYDYDLDIDGNGNIIGGEWRSRSRPDFLWLKQRPYRYTGLLFRLGELLED